MGEKRGSGNGESISDSDYEDRIRYFDSRALEYDAWFDDHPAAYESELRAVRCALTAGGRGVDIGVGTGRFAESLGIATGVDPSVKMGAIARARGIGVVCGVAEQLPFGDGRFDFALMVTVLLFLDDPIVSLREVYRVIRGGGSFVLMFVDADGALARHYERRKHMPGSTYRYARFYTVGEVEHLLRFAGFGRFAYHQTIYRMPEDIREIEPVREGYGEGSVVVVTAAKQIM